LNIPGQYRKPLPDASRDDARMRIEHERSNNVLRSQIQAARTYTDEQIAALEASLTDLGDTLRSSITALGGTVDILGSNVDTLTGTVQGLTGNLESLTGTVQGLTGNLESLTGTVQGLSETVEALAETVGSLAGGMLQKFTKTFPDPLPSWEFLHSLETTFLIAYMWDGEGNKIEGVLTPVDPNNARVDWIEEQKGAITVIGIHL
jgi:hypothetical protein